MHSHPNMFTTLKVKTINHHLKVHLEIELQLKEIQSKVFNGLPGKNLWSETLGMCGESA